MRDLEPAHLRRRVRRAARADRRRQDDDAAPRRRAGEAGSRHDPDRRPRRHRARARRPRRRLRLPAVFALSASVGVRQPRLPAALAGAQDERGRGPPPRRGGGEAGAHRPQAGEPLDQAVRRRDAARRDRPRAGAQAVDLPDGRAAVVARRQAARRAAARAEAHPDRARRDRALRHPRPDRGDDDGRPHRHPRRRRARADRHAEDDLHRAGQPARRRAPRPAGDQPPAGRPPARRRCAARARRRSAHAPSIWRSRNRRTAMPTARSTGSSTSATRTTCM